jgi:hypothetical protein
VCLWDSALSLSANYVTFQGFAFSFGCTRLGELGRAEGRAWEEERSQHVGTLPRESRDFNKEKDEQWLRLGSPDDQPATRWEYEMESRGAVA